MTIDDFLNYLRYERNYSERTVQSYGKDLRAFESYFKNSKKHVPSWESVDSDIIRDWMEHMMDKGNNASSINRRLSALRSFYRFALSRRLIVKDPAHGLTGPKKSKLLPQFLRENEMDRLLDDVLGDVDDYNKVRARTIIMMFYSTGMRLSELVGLEESMIDMDACQLKVTGKRNKQRMIPFGEELKTELMRYMRMRNEQFPDAQTSALFLTDKGQAMNSEQVRYLVRKHLSMVSTLKKRTPHVLRHTFATTMLNHDAGLESVKKLLGHESLTTTEIYTHTTFEQLKRVYEKAHPRA
jgi:integrase/recombinase XerC